MRHLAIVLAAALMTLPAVASARTGAAHTAKSAATDFAAKKKTKKVAKAMVKKKKKHGNAEYMRAVPYK